MKVGINLGIDVTKIDKSKLVKGKYLNMVSFVDLDNKDKYDNNGMITMSLSKDDKAKGEKGPILGNAKVFWRDDKSEDVNDEIPF